MTKPGPPRHLPQHTGPPLSPAIRPLRYLTAPAPALTYISSHPSRNTPASCRQATQDLSTRSKAHLTPFDDLDSARPRPCMTLFHVHFLLRNQQAFQRLLDANINDRTKLTGRSPSGGKSWSKTTSFLTEVNARDAEGRTVLHLAAAASDGLEYVKLLLRHPSIDVNAQDAESRWTALHRALYHGNVLTACVSPLCSFLQPAQRSFSMLLLQRPEIDATARDIEGYTAFDLYNSTVEGTSPSSDFENGELYTWGTNRNAALGVGDGDDRLHPEQILLRSKDTTFQSSLRKRFGPLPVKDIRMSKLHTGASHVSCDVMGFVSIMHAYSCDHCRRTCERPRLRFRERGEVRCCS
jgi:hypothetical protein